MPWGRQTVVNNVLAVFYELACTEMQRVLTPDGFIAVLTSLPELVRFPTLCKHSSHQISLYGQRPRILIFTNP
jgi:hypothetical protein